MKSLIVLLLIVSLVNSQDNQLLSGITCANVRCMEACLDNPTRCVTKCNATKICPEDKYCESGYCEDKPKSTCATTLCITGTVCLENPTRCLKPCCDNDNCPEDSICSNEGYCEKKPKLTCDTIDCRRGYVCRRNRCVKQCKTKKGCPKGNICSNGHCQVFTGPKASD